MGQLERLSDSVWRHLEIECLGAQFVEDAEDLLQSSCQSALLPPDSVCNLTYRVSKRR